MTESGTAELPRGSGRRIAFVLGVGAPLRWYYGCVGGWLIIARGLAYLIPAAWGVPEVPAAVAILVVGVILLAFWWRLVASLHNDILVIRRGPLGTERVPLATIESVELIESERSVVVATKGTTVTIGPLLTEKQLPALRELATELTRQIEGD